MCKAIGLYIHIPFCKRKCHYCDFYSVAADPDRIRRYADALILDIQKKASELSDVVVDTVFIGGGTPSVLGDELVRILDAARVSFCIADEAEITCEANPDSLSKDLIVKLKMAGVNRISIGVQSFCSDELGDLGRIHDCEQAIAACQSIADAGVQNYNIDLMFGIGHQNTRQRHFDAFAKSLETAIALNVPHISCYNLTLQKHTRLYDRVDDYRFADEEEEERMYQHLCQTMAEHGYRHYEISNFAKPGFECRHNIKYWSGESYLGIGPAAHSFINGIRYRYAEDLDNYMNGNLPITVEETITCAEKAREHLIFGLRMDSGVKLSLLEGYFDCERIQKCVDRFEEYSLCRKTEHGFSLTEEGFRVSNTIIDKLLDFYKG